MTIRLRKIDESDAVWAGQFECSECGQRFIADPANEDLVHIEFGKHVGQLHKPPKTPSKKKRGYRGRFIGKDRIR
jgi:hypothetical protein